MDVRLTQATNVNSRHTNARGACSGFDRPTLELHAGEAGLYE